MIKASDSRFRNFAEGLCESYQASMLAERDELVKAVDDAWADGAAWNAAPDADKARIAAWGVWRDAKDALIAYDKENI
jgi:hypothetical protein